MKRGLIYPKLEEYILSCTCIDEEDYEEIDDILTSIKEILDKVE